MLGSLQKMTTQLAETVSYRLPVGDAELDLNPLIGQPVQLRHSGRIFCVHCQKKTNKSFNQGYCYPCFIKLAQCDMCIMKPETCHYAAGTCREPSWGEAFCFQPHIVYLANSSGIKVGITRRSQTPTRWIDQGAVQALPIFQVASRHISGLIEVALAAHVSDKTSWQQMLKNNVQPLDLPALRDELLAKCTTQLAAIAEQFGSEAITFLADAETLRIEYPVLQYPAKVKSFNLDKDPQVSGVLQGIKGQYLLLDSGVINIRKFSGYEVEVSY
ncbi:MAG: DUF2797 domain-containing protein [Methylomonas sp.]|uniref:DUF2797 domain-containing protein n=1 Tax=Methylomonas sp. TaxID=418 RepID=UPI0025EC9849|nr:DUF2797 domain-containing protein [Methylomonas sp.]MCK9607091.1 DUF2797 domain-containing protein [Methylomonas sp.]